MIAPSLSEPQPPDASPSLEVDYRVPTVSTPGRSLVTRRAVVDIVRTATVGSYGVTGFAGRGPLGGVFEWLGLAQPGIRVSFDHDAPGASRDGETAGDRLIASGLTIELDLTVAYGVPVAEVARQVDSAVRYAIRQALDATVARFTIHVGGLRYRTGDLPANASASRASVNGASAVGIDDLAASGTDVA
jgi:uncharacterized alkaline shock family protein YloU